MGINEIVDVICANHDELLSLAVNRTAELVHMGMEYARKTNRKNDNWDIIWAIPVPGETPKGCLPCEIVIGDRHTDFQPYVAWHCFGGNSYTLGDYCQTFGGAFDCAIEKLCRELGIKREEK